jgi:pilus assembly protein CpaC
MMMDFTPIVLENQTIELATNVGVSALDFSQGLQINGTKVPLFKTRSSQTTVRLRSGQSFAIAGLLSDEMANSMRYMPGLGQIPILGALFSSKSFKRNETELLVIITARLVNPLEEGSALQLPSDAIVDPNDLEFFVLNLFEGMDQPEKKNYPNQRSESEMPKLPAGQVGFWR